MGHAYIFPGQGSQFPGMGKHLYEKEPGAIRWFEEANDILGFRISDIMFEGSGEDLKQTRVTQPAIFLHSVIAFRCAGDLAPDMVAGHSLGEFSALAACGCLHFDTALKLVAARANAMQMACELVPSTMAAILALEDGKVEEVCRKLMEETGETVVPANYNCPGQVVISGTVRGVEEACVRMKAAGAKRALILPVGGAFHSPLMEPARQELQSAIRRTHFQKPSCPVFQNVVATGVTDPEQIRENLNLQLTMPVLWTQSVRAMVQEGAKKFTEVGPGKVLQGLVQKIDPGVEVSGIT
ncbi:MAG TPA: ACP S-malonyltransferase [Chitinophagaceae bacterium]|nr:ACP S-malonyltransferase [Chitinophagaceae bacterium]